MLCEALSLAKHVSTVPPASGSGCIYNVSYYKLKAVYAFSFLLGLTRAATPSRARSCLRLQSLEVQELRDAKEVEAQAAELQTMTEMSTAVGSDSKRSEANADAQS